MRSRRLARAVAWSATGALAIALVGGCSRQAPARPTVRVAAASDLSAAFEEIARAVEAESGARVTLTFGSSGQLAAQIAHGAPFDLFASASVELAARAAESGACEPDPPTPYARGRLVLYCPGGAPAGGVAGLAATAPAKIALANPEHAPYGAAAVQAIDRAGVHARVKDRLVLASNVGESLRMAKSGNAACAFASRSLVRGEPAARVTEIPADLHAPIVQALVRCKGGATPGDRVARDRFVAYVRGAEGQATLARYGFEPP